MYKLTIAYDGTHFGGWQTQPNATCIQELIEKALSTILRGKVSIVGSGRTDAGVHASGQTAHFACTAPFDLNKTLLSLNGILPDAIRILSLETAPDNFHARYSARAKTYHYHLRLHTLDDPFTAPYTYRVPHRVDLKLLRQAAAHFIGTHDFTSFANEPRCGSAAKNAVRTLNRLDIIEEGSKARLEFEGNGFLYKMVRNIVGTLLDVAAGKIGADSIPSILAAKDRRCAGRAAPAHGLFLVHVEY